ncbi:MAG TPA: nucleoside triphosphate pyrophosphohydrolase [Polyangiaceae bacterium]|nr:nucleoside triphosphate pyrophosphohydrolase [Polyangiaceae bacterium]
MGRPFQIPEELPLHEQRGQTFPSLVEIMQRLLAADGCPWDREQTFESLRKYVLEEACEVIDAVDSGSREHLREELGDLALQVAFLGELARQEGSFGPDDVVRAIVEKLVRRHPHVFADADVQDSDEVVRNWERIKAQEKSERGVLDGVPRSLPALYRAQRMSDKVSRVGFDWPDGRGSREKVSEELRELDEAIAGGDKGRIEAELGDMLFALVNLARHAGVDAETALRGSCDRFAARFAHVEGRVKERHGGWPRAGDGSATRGVPLEVMDGYWDEAKREGK